jgi:hypothetical protein
MLNEQEARRGVDNTAVLEVKGFGGEEELELVRSLLPDQSGSCRFAGCLPPLRCFKFPYLYVHSETLE